MGISVLKEVLFPAGVVAHTVILALGGERQKDPKFKASLGSKTQNKRILLITNCFRDRGLKSPLVVEMVAVSS